MGTVGAARVGWLLLAGCNVAWGIKQVPAPDAPPSCAALTSHDEDGDGVVDSCDKCPGIPDDQADSDGDGVGDACDPSPGVDHIALFESFAEPGAGSGWTIQGGPWGFNDDAAIYTILSNAAPAEIDSKLPPLAPSRIEAVVTIDAIAAQGSFIQLVADVSVRCGVVRHTGTSMDKVRVDINGGTTNSESDFPTLMTSQRLRITLTCGGKTDCTVENVVDGTVGNAMISETGSAGPLGVADLGIPTHVEYVAVYASGP
jgi:hypothetical protein